MLFLRALIAFLLLPGIVAGALPAYLCTANGDVVFDRIAILPFAVGVWFLLWCVRDFYVAGTGTLAPWDPPKHLVAIGLYRWSRNPMYVSVTVILAGWITLCWSASMIVYALIVVAMFHLRVILAEEPYLARTHGAVWEDYKRACRAGCSESCLILSGPLSTSTWLPFALHRTLRSTRRSSRAERPVFLPSTCRPRRASCCICWRA